MKLITKDTDYAIRALTLIAKEKNKLFNVKEISKSLNISYSYLRKLLQILNKNKILFSVKGKGGGFKINKDPEEIYIKDLIKLFQKDIEIKNCYIKSKNCPNKNVCILSAKLSKIESVIREELFSLNIKSFLD